MIVVVVMVRDISVVVNSKDMVAVVVSGEDITLMVVDGRGGGDSR